MVHLTRWHCVLKRTRSFEVHVIFTGQDLTNRRPAIQVLRRKFCMQLVNYDASPPEFCIFYCLFPRFFIIFEKRFRYCLSLLPLRCVMRSSFWIAKFVTEHVVEPVVEFGITFNIAMVLAQGKFQVRTIDFSGFLVGRLLVHLVF